MNIYHITYALDVKSLCLHFWGCNMSCRGCLCQKEIYDCHLDGIKDSIFEERKKPVEKPARFLDFNQVLENFVRIYSSGKRLRAESVFIPDYIECLEIERIAKFIAGVNRATPYRIDAYFPARDNPWRKATPEEVEEAVGVARKHLLNVSCLKGDEKLKYKVLRIY